MCLHHTLVGWARPAHKLMQQPRPFTQLGPSKIVPDRDWTGPKSRAMGRPMGHMAIYISGFFKGQSTYWTQSYSIKTAKWMPRRQRTTNSAQGSSSFRSRSFFSRLDFRYVHDDNLYGRPSNQNAKNTGTDEHDLSLNLGP